MADTLFDLPPGAVIEREPVEKLSPNKRRLILHRRRIYPCKADIFEATYEAPDGD